MKKFAISITLLLSLASIALLPLGASYTHNTNIQVLDHGVG